MARISATKAQRPDEFADAVLRAPVTGLDLARYERSVGGGGTGEVQDAADARDPQRLIPQVQQPACGRCSRIRLRASTSGFLPTPNFRANGIQ